MEQNQGYISKTIKHGNITVTVRRPDLTDTEREKRAKQITERLGYSLRDYLKK